MELEAKNNEKIFPVLDREPLHCPQCNNFHFLHKTESVIICVYCRWKGTVEELK